MTSAIGVNMMSGGGVSGGGSSKPPKKYVKIDGVMQLNPEYTRWKEGSGEKATTALNPSEALPVVTNMEEHMEYNAANKDAGEAPAPLAPSTDMTIEMLQDDDVCAKVGLSSEALVDDLGKIFAKYEVPMGLMNKLMYLSEYDELEFIIDDSGSMNANSDTKDSSGRTQTRWNEAKTRLKSMVEMMAYVPTPPIHVHFFNRNDEVRIQRSGETPERFIEKANAEIDRVFSKNPSGGTPAERVLKKSFASGKGKRVSRYFFCDGQPSGGSSERGRITDMVRKRDNAEGNPLTFLSCTNEDEEVEWMKEAEEVAPFCAEYDDFEDEAREVLRDQGKALPYTKGFHLIGQLIGAMCPDDLDAMDESVPFTKFTLDNLLGVQTNEAEYRRYFDGFVEAQRTRKIEGEADRLKQSFNWAPLFNSFVSTNVAKTIPQVQDFKRKLDSVV